MRKMDKAKIKYTKDQKVEIVMIDHIWRNCIGTVTMVLENESIPDAVLVKVNENRSDWFFGVEENLKILDA